MEANLQTIVSFHYSHSLKMLVSIEALGEKDQADRFVWLASQDFLLGDFSNLLLWRSMLQMWTAESSGCKKEDSDVELSQRRRAFPCTSFHFMSLFCTKEASKMMCFKKSVWGDAQRSTLHFIFKLQLVYACMRNIHQKWHGQWILQHWNQIMVSCQRLSTCVGKQMI